MGFGVYKATYKQLIPGGTPIVVMSPSCQGTECPLTSPPADPTDCALWTGPCRTKRGETTAEDENLPAKLLNVYNAGSPRYKLVYKPRYLVIRIINLSSY